MWEPLCSVWGLRDYRIQSLGFVRDTYLKGAGRNMPVSWDVVTNYSFLLPPSTASAYFEQVQCDGECDRQQASPWSCELWQGRMKATNLRLFLKEHIPHYKPRERSFLRGHLYFYHGRQLVSSNGSVSFKYQSWQSSALSLTQMKSVNVKQLGSGRALSGFFSIWHLTWHYVN